MPLDLHINVDHIATLRQARKTVEPSPLEAVKILDQYTDAKGITTHLREDRRHIQDSDIYEIDAYLRESKLGFTFEMGATDEIRKICLQTQAALATIVPESRAELTTEGGMDLLGTSTKEGYSRSQDYLKEFIKPIQENGTKISLFIDPELAQIEAAKNIGADFVELHTGTYANSFIDNHPSVAAIGPNFNAEVYCKEIIPSMQLNAKTAAEILRISQAVSYAHEMELKVNLGHGLTVTNLAFLIPALNSTANHELHIGHSLVANSAYYGLKEITKIFSELLAWVE